MGERELLQNLLSEDPELRQTATRDLWNSSLSPIGN